MTDDVKRSPVPPSRPTAQQLAVLDALRTRGMQRIGELLKGMLDRFADVMHGLSKDLPDAQQQAFMDTVRQVKAKREDLITQFGSALSTAFQQLKQAPDPKAAGKPASIDFSKLSLVETDDMDISVTVDSMVSRARLRYAAPLNLLRRRYAWVTGRPDLIERDVPLDPVCITSAFKEALMRVEVPASQKVVVLRVFNKLVLDEAESLLEECNQLFVGAGVLPNIKPEAGANDAAKKAKPKQEPAKPGDAAKGADLAKTQRDAEQAFSAVQSLLSQSGIALSGDAAGETMPASGQILEGTRYHGGQYVGGGGIGSLPAATVGGSVAAVPITPTHISATATVQRVETPDLVSRLSQMQQDQPRAPLAEDESAPTVEQVRTSIRDNLRSDDETVEAIRRVDEDVINLVSMLFDILLGDKDLPAAMKALLARLQVPMLKVAIIDKSFFNQDRHPARRLINALAKAGIGWNSRSQGGDVLYARIESVVLRILNDFADDLGLFEELFDDFTSFVEQQKKREDTVDKRTRETEEGRARAELARAMVQQTLNRRLAGKQLPVVAVKLLQEAWRQVLYICCLKEGTDTEAWKQAVKVVDAVVWSVIPQPGPEWTARLAALAPKLLNSLRKGLSGVNYDSLSRDSLLREFSEVHAVLLRGEATATVSVVDAKTAAASPVQGQVAAADVARTDTARLSSVVLPEDESQTAGEEVLPEDNSFVQLVARMSVGAWVEFTGTDLKQEQRHKLVARIRSVDKLIFANRRGVKVAEMSGMQLALDMSLGRARVLEEAEFVDRALESMIGSLRTLGSKAAAQGASA
jgi:hypothetical protein